MELARFYAACLMQTYAASGMFGTHTSFNQVTKILSNNSSCIVCKNSILRVK